MITFSEYVASSLTESMDEDFVLQALADKDINAVIDDKEIIVDKSDVQEATKIVKKIGCTRKVIARKE